MKKQFLFLAMITLAFIFAGTTKVLGQLPQTTLTIDPISCAGSSLPLHPMPGVPYTYRMTGTNADQWTWWATKDSSFINASGLNMTNMLTVTTGQLLATGTNYGNAVAGADSVSITWSPQILANTLYQGVASTTTFPSPTFVVGYATGTDCADNIEVYEINPVPAFVIDIANVGTSGTMNWDQDTSSCVSDVYSATYNSAKDSLMMNYGWDTLYFEVVAQNFVTSFTPYLTLEAGLSGSQTATIGIASSLSNAQNGTFLGTGAVAIAVGDSTSFGGVDLTPTNPGDEVTGVSFWVRVVIANNTYESLAAQTLTLAVDGRDVTGQWDLEDTSCADPSSATYDETDLANHIIRPRPTIDANQTPMGEPNSVAPDTIIDKQRN